MAKKRRSKDDPEPEDSTELEAARDDPTRPAVDASSMMAAHDQFEAVKAGEANPPPSEMDKTPPVPIAPVEELLPAIIPLKVFIKLAGPKPDQMAGFLSYAKLRKMAPRSVPEWRAAYQDFLRKPMK